MQEKKFDLRKFRIVLVLACVVMQGIVWGLGIMTRFTAAGFLVSDVFWEISLLIDPINWKT